MFKIIDVTLGYNLFKTIMYDMSCTLFMNKS